MASSSNSSSSGTSSRNCIENTKDFATFLQGWMVRQEHYLDELQSAARNSHESLPDDMKELITRVLLHYQQYYQRKSIAAEQNVFQVFSPDYFSSLEKSFLWIAGFKPGLAFKLVKNSVKDLSSGQLSDMNKLASETRGETRSLNEDMAKIHESLASPPFFQQVKVSARVPVDGERLDVEASIDALRASMESILLSADMLRTSTAAKVVDVLSPAQGVRFLAAATQLQLHVRSWGLQRDAERAGDSDAD